MSKRTLYEVLGVDPGATQARIDARFRGLSQDGDHPEFGGDPSAWEPISEAYDTLSDPKLRYAYDRRLAEVGKIIGNDYLIIRKIASGAMGETYLARDLTLGKLVVVKHCSKLNPDRQSLLRDQARKMFDLDHHAIPTVRRLIELPNGTLALVMGYKPGLTLVELVEEYGKLHPESVTWITARVLNALWFMHHRGVVHGGLEPHNIIVDAPRYQVSVVDFGFSQVAGAPSARSLGYIKCFAPPEQEVGDALLPESDHYSLGAVMIYMLSGGNLDRVASRHVSRRLDSRLKDFMRPLLQPDILARPQHAQQLFAELNALRQDLFDLTNDHTRGVRSAK